MSRLKFCGLRKVANGMEQTNMNLKGVINLHHFSFAFRKYFKQMELSWKLFIRNKARALVNNSIITRCKTFLKRRCKHGSQRQDDTIQFDFDWNYLFIRNKAMALVNDIIITRCKTFLKRRCKHGSQRQYLQDDTIQFDLLNICIYIVTGLHSYNI